MFNRLRVFWKILAALLVASLIPLFVLVIVSAGSTTAIGISLAAAVVLALVVAVWLAGSFTRPVRQLARHVNNLVEAADAETGDAITPQLDALARLDLPQDMDDLAIGSCRLGQLIQQRINEFNTIYTMGQAISAELDFEDTVRAVIRAMQQVVGFDAAEVSVARGKVLVVEAWIGRKDFNDTTGREYRIGRGPTGMIASTKAPVFMPTITSEDDLKRTLGYATEAGEFLMKTTKVVINSFLGIPLLIGERLIGTLTLVHSQPGHFTEADKRQLNKLAAQASIAIDNAIKIRQRENALKAQIRELRVEIDHKQLEDDVEKITTTDYFQSLQADAARMRKRVYTRRTSPTNESEPSVEPDSDQSTDQ
ncbi:MAG: GAF domain-containing protein [Anaerolineae bacterium]|nr:GAF domain-containing protein [Anaerolineae bacterium]